MPTHQIVAGMLVPKWLVKMIVSALITLVLGGGVAAGTHISNVTQDHEKRIAVVEDHQKGIDKNLDEIKEMQREQSQDTKEILKRLPRR